MLLLLRAVLVVAVASVTVVADAVAGAVAVAISVGAAVAVATDFHLPDPLTVQGGEFYRWKARGNARTLL